jgi:hypothetical protein
MLLAKSYSFRRALSRFYLRVKVIGLQLQTRRKALLWDGSLKD